jgi:hypothetical protein
MYERVWRRIPRHCSGIYAVSTNIKHFLKNFQENGSAGRKPESGRPKKRTPEVIEEARQAMEEAPGTSIEHLSQQLGVSVGTCHSIVKKDLHLFPYRLTSVQELHPVDLPQRLEYCQWFLNTLDVHLDKTFYTDEAYFHLSLKIQECGVQKIHIFSLKHPSTPRK